MTAQGFKVSGLHGDMEQKQREVTIRAFKQGGIDIFIATDVAARGLDVNDVTHVFNYHIPFDSESYVHRIGRTGRAGKTGEAITLVSPNELRTIKKIEKDVGTKMASQVIPTRMEVQNNRSDELIARIAETKVTDKAIELVKTLQHDLDIVTIAHLLASMIQSENSVKGKDNIGLGLEEIALLMEKAMTQRGGGGGRNRRRGGGGGGYRRNRSGGGGRNRHGRNGRSGGGRDSRNGGQGSRG
ncbi:MAG: C-terminal helicase domain-containing protein, partial [Sulfurovum sp.]|nr:C-terminal helicase domain-containing protein [Sulfurovum sp.]